MGFLNFPMAPFLLHVNQTAFTAYITVYYVLLYFPAPHTSLRDEHNTHLAVTTDHYVLEDR